MQMVEAGHADAGKVLLEAEIKMETEV